MEALFSSGRVADLVLAVMAIEFALLAVARRRRDPPGPLAPLAWTFASGAALVVALRFALTDAGWPWIAAALSAALVAHMGDLAQRR